MQKLRLVYINANVIMSWRGAGMGTYGHFVRKIINVRTANFILLEFVHKGRVSNVDAHVLARNSIYCAPGRHVWLIDLPHGICNTYNFVD